jgi:hypothetical protein
MVLNRGFFVFTVVPAGLGFGADQKGVASGLGLNCRKQG